MTEFNTEGAPIPMTPTTDERLAAISDQRAAFKAELLTLEPTLRRIAELAAPLPEAVCDLAEYDGMFTPEEELLKEAALRAKDADALLAVNRAASGRNDAVYEKADTTGFLSTIDLLIGLLETARDGESYRWDRKLVDVKGD